jgi:hypothetical protein
LQYLDSDNDGFGSTTVVACGVADNSDCNDNNGAMHTSFAFYADADGDSYGAGDIVSGVCAVDAQTAPAGYSVNNTDCDDSNANVYQSGTLFVDADSDGYTNGNTAVVCYGGSAPSGYAMTNIGIDCNDNSAAINPGHAEVLYNGIDDNCDGNLDEGNQITTQIVASQCGTTLAAIGTNISAVSIPQVNGYRFEVTNTTTNAIQIIEKGVQYFNLTQLASYDYATTYSIRVEVKRNGIWLGYYGPSCLVSSPAVTSSNGAAQINPSQCGITLPSINTLIATTSLAGVTGYRFRVTNISDPSVPGQVQQIDRGVHWFSLPMLGNYNYGTTYIIEVAVKTNGAYSGFGNACQITAPAVPQINSCGTTIPTPVTYISTASLAKVTSYRFEVTNLVSNQVTTLNRSQNWFTFNMIPGFSPSTLYGVRVAVMTAGAFSLFSDACEITSPGFARPDGPKADVAAQTAFSAVAYPNPFSENFMIDVKTSSEAQISIKVYDMAGRILDTRNIEVQEMESQEIGANYPAGVYNVIVTQGADVKTLRVVKR